MKKLLTIFFASGFLQIASAQFTSGGNEFQVTIGPEFSIPKYYSEYGYFKNDNEGYFNFCYLKGKPIVVQLFDDKLHMMSEHEIDISQLSPKLQHEDFMKIGTNWFWFYSLWDRSIKKHRLFAQQVDVNAGKFINPPKTIVEVDGPIWYGYQFETSLKKDLLFIYYTYPSDEKKKELYQRKMGFTVLNSNLDVMWKMDYRIPFIDDLCDYIDYAVDVNNNVYLLSIVWNDKDAIKKSTATNFHYEVLKADGKSSEFSRVTLKLEGKMPERVKLTVDQSGNLICTGFYSRYDVNKPEDVHFAMEGLFLTKVDMTSGDATSSQMKFYDFPAKEMSLFESEKTLKDQDKDYGRPVAIGLEMRNIIMQEDGSIILFAEERMIKSVTEENNGHYYERKYYHYYNILGINIDSKGNLVWVKKIPKYQYSDFENHLSFNVIQKGKSFYVVYLDDPENMNLSVTDKPKMYDDDKKGSLVYTRIDEDGKMTKGEIYNTRENELKWYKHFQRIDQNSIGVIANNKKSDMLFKLSLLNK